MKKTNPMKPLSILTFLCLPMLIFSQDCDCSSNYAWVKKTFEENDAGYAYALQKKGRELYEAHNSQIAAKVAAVETLQ